MRVTTLHCPLGNTLTEYTLCPQSRRVLLAGMCPAAMDPEPLGQNMGPTLLGRLSLAFFSADVV